MPGENVGDKSLTVADGVRKTYFDEGVPVHAVGGVDVVTGKGEFTAIVGPSGSGKTRPFST